jgi:hypothetical protein
VFQFFIVDSFLFLFLFNFVCHLSAADTESSIGGDLNSQNKNNANHYSENDSETSASYDDASESASSAKLSAPKKIVKVNWIFFFFFFFFNNFEKIESG